MKVALTGLPLSMKTTPVQALIQPFVRHRAFVKNEGRKCEPCLTAPIFSFLFVVACFLFSRTQNRFFSLATVLYYINWKQIQQTDSSSAVYSEPNAEIISVQYRCIPVPCITDTVVEVELRNATTV
jgi:hypothetical protein